MKELNFSMRIGDFAVVSCPKHLVCVHDEPNKTIDFVKYYKSNGRELKYSIGYFYYDEHEPCWVLHFVGDRFTEVPPELRGLVWGMLAQAYEVLTEWKAAESEE